MGSSKLFKRLGIALTGMAMAIGVGVGLSQRGEYKEARAASPVSRNSFSATSGYVDSANSDTTISYEVLKGTGTTNPAVNSNQIRMYKPSGSNTTGNYIHLTATSGYVITTVSLTNANSSASSYRIQVGDNASISGTTNIAKNSTATVSNISTSSLYFYVSGSNAIYLSALSVTYSSGSATTYTVTYNGNGSSGGSNVTDSNSPYCKGATVTTLENTWTKSGYAFDGWNTADNGSGASYDEAETFVISSNTTLYAQWVESKSVSSVVLSVSSNSINGGILNYSSVTLAPTVTYSDASSDAAVSYKVTDTNSYDADASSFASTQGNKLYFSANNKTVYVWATSTLDGETHSSSVSVSSSNLLAGSELSTSSLNITSTSYTDFSGTVGGVSYSGNCMTNTQKEYLQFRSNSGSGIVATSTGGLIKYIYIEVNKSGGNFTVYGQTTSSYANVTDLENEATRGTSIGNYSATTGVIDLTSNAYQYFGIKSAAAIYLTKIVVAWQGVNPTNIAVSGESSVRVGQTITLTATPSNSNGYIITNTAYTWSSSDVNYATVDANGVVTGVAAGTATIFATSDGDHNVVGSKEIEITAIPSNYIDLSVETSTGTTNGYKGDVVAVTVDDSSLSEGGHINWSVSGGTITDQETADGYFMGTLTSTGTITITATDSGNNENTESVEVVVYNSINEVLKPNTTTITWAASAESSLGGLIASVNGTATKELLIFDDDDNSMTSVRTLEFLAAGKSDYLSYSSPYLQFGSSNALEKLVLTTDSSINNVKKVVVNCGSKSGAATVSVTVGGNAFGASKSAPDGKGPVSFTGSASGVVVITMENETKTAGTAQYIASVAITYSDGTTTNIANGSGYHLAQSAVLEYASSFNATLSSICVSYGTTDAEALESAWGTLSSTFTSWFVNDGKSLSNANKTRALELFAYASAVDRNVTPSADELQHMLAKYNWIVNHYHFSDFLNTTAGRAEIVYVSRIVGSSSFELGISDNNLIIVIAVVSAVSLLTVGCYFFIRRRKER